MNALTVTNLCKAYPGFELKDVSFSFPQGTILGFIGENGAGKTTTLKAVLNLIRRDGGAVEIMGMDSIAQGEEIRRQIGVVMDESCFHDGLSRSQIAKILRDIYPNWDDGEFARLCRQFKLPEQKTVKEYSKGMKTKLNIAAALSHRPKLLILDEPTSGLDPVVREEILDIFREFVQDETNSVILSSHITSDLDKIADYIAFIHEGRIVLNQSKDELLDEMGVVKCGEAEFARLPEKDMLRYRKNQFGVEALVQNRRRWQAQYPELAVDPANLEEIMLFYIRGEKR